MSEIQQLIREHRLETTRLREEQEARYRELTAHLTGAGALLVDTVNKDLADVFSAQHALEAEAKELQLQTQRFAKQTQSWVALFDQFNKSLKELGDVSNWAKFIEADIHSVVQTMTAIAESNRSPTTRR
eukprot:GGOE01041606.1.p1 GENE.GGOE01041606.1~~GGOE01041606.1.p1  ORF type:complete len:150 (-),score=35.41 GGOE01041606.1:73-459(-)